MKDKEEKGTRNSLFLRKAKRQKAIAELMQKAKLMGKTFSKLTVETFVASIREDRDPR